MSTATQGRSREHKTRDHLTAHGWHLVSRSAGSKGAADLVMVHPSRGIALVQVGTASKTLGPADRARLLDLAGLCAAVPLVAICAPRQPIDYREVTLGPPSAWPAWSATKETP